MAHQIRRKFRRRTEFLRAGISKRRYIAYTSITFTAVIGAWITVSALKLFPVIFLPSPLAVANALWVALSSGAFCPIFGPASGA